MKRAERILGIISMATFILGLVFKYLNLPGGGILVCAPLLTFVLGYLPVNYILQRGIARSLPGRIFLLLKLMAYALVMLGAVFMIMHWMGGEAFLAMGMILVLPLIGLNYYLRSRNFKRPQTGFNELVIGVLALSVFFYVNRPKASKYALERTRTMLMQKESRIAGLEQANRVIYESIDSLNLVRDLVLKTGLMEVREVTGKMLGTYESIADAFVDYCNRQYPDPDSTIKGINPSALTSFDLGTDFFITAGNATRLRKAILEYWERVDEIADHLHLSYKLIGMGLDVGDVEDVYGHISSWEDYYFADHRVNVIYSYLLEIKQMVLQTEGVLLNGLINQVDLSAETMLLQEIAAREAARAMDLKENEIIRMQQQQELQDMQLRQSESQLQQRNTIIVSAFAGIGLVLSLLIISTRAFYLKRRDNRNLARQQLEISSMNEALEQRNEEIMAQRDEIEAQRDMVYKQNELLKKTNTEISSSIDYAKRLQTSILPSPGLLNTRIADHFVLFIPKHRVSGDFYWWTQIEDQVVVTAADCTGHGVPGAFMSMLGVSMLREIVSKEYISHPGVILRRLRKEVMYALKQTGEFGEQKDGMDMALVSINVETLECQYAGANNPLYLVRDGELTEYKADRMPIAIHQNMAKFTTRDIQLKRGDHLYLFSDGYVDQFGGPDDKKFKYVAFRQMLVDHAGLPMKKQREVLERAHLDWRGDREQVDDIVVLGLEI